ncbi:MarR family winged helix-turn-helix transcriptional regulator [Bacillus velezensis]|nr:MULTISPECIES: MarR family transcriptional regulator [Bacillus]ARM27511.1 MarR family transcriptional regulator [Bacillus vallismortis]ANF36223.1 organic peroxide-sensing transcriptional regulator [Bacillus velezensis]ANS38037.1 MarR family transcriptional regulator [Bacillus velezensis]ANU29797.1 MarR family transcriptional regulator [Bacillus velezensis]APQ49508.1 MarR family transcriptional regulator [Bacillus amyloliquefaciens]
MGRFSATIGVTLTNKELVKEVMAEKEFEHMKLENQLCFLLYASSREMTKRYKPLLDKLNVTYPQYLALLLLWEHEELNVKRMGELLYLDSGTLTPMLKRMEQHGIIMRKRSAEDERSVTIRLTDEGRALQKTAADIPIAMLEQTGRSKEELKQLKQSLYEVLNTLHGKK